MNNDIEIREATLDDRRKIYDWLFYADFSDFLNRLQGIQDGSIPSFEEFKDDYRNYFFDGSREKDGRSYIIQAKSGEEMGHISYTGYHMMDGMAEIDIWLKSLKYMGYGIGTKAVRLLATQLLHKGYQKIITRPSKQNIPAIRSYQKAGFKEREKNLKDYYKPEYIDLYGAGDYGEGMDVLLVLEKF